jgi:hypothetical protein
MTSNTEVADVLEKAANHVRSGWTQYRPFDVVNEKVYACANGAIWLAAGLEVGPSEWGPANLNLWTTVCAKLAEHVGQDVTGWNDSIGQTQGRVADTMLHLAKELRNNETP